MSWFEDEPLWECDVLILYICRGIVKYHIDPIFAFLFYTVKSLIVPNIMNDRQNARSVLAPLALL